MLIQPIGERVLIEKIFEKNEKMSMGGIILYPEKKSQEVLMGKVIGLGDIEGIKVEDNIIYGIAGEIEIPGDERLAIVNLEYIYAIKRG
ncbi:MAG: co-chaperone GroES family protein [Fusobacteriaceae bacterium]